jgi:hypothetical protein
MEHRATLFVAGRFLPTVQDFLAHPAVQGGIAPLLVALAFGAAFARSRFAWLAVVAGYATAVGLATGIAFSPLTAGRKLTLVVLLSALVGLVADRWPPTARGFVATLAIASAIVAPWVFVSVLAQREGASGYLAAIAIGLFVAASVYGVTRMRHDGLRIGAAGLALGLATGILGVLSASIGYLLAGIAVAAAAGAMLLVQVGIARSIAAGFTGALPIGLGTALFAAGTVMLAELRWYLVPLLLLVPAAAALPVPQSAPHIARAALLALYAVAAAAVPILAAWLAARGSPS